MSRIAKTLACILATAALATVAAPGAAHADNDKAPTIGNLGQQASNASSPDGSVDPYYASNCKAALTGLDKAGTADTTPVQITRDTATLKKGTVTYAEVKASCRAAYGKAIIKMMQQQGTGIGSLNYHLQDFDPKDNHSVNTLAPLVKICNQLTAEAVEYGLDPAQPLNLDYGPASKWSGTLADVKPQICDKATAALKAAVDAQLEPYTKAGIGGDKLAMLAEYYPLGFYIPGGSYSQGDTDPALLKKANVWFVISEGDYCDNLKTNWHFVRYQFGKDQKLAKTTEKDYCGDPGAKAVK